MKMTRRILSLVLALLMVTSVMSVAFVSTYAAAPYVTRTRDVMPAPDFIVPEYIETYGTNDYVPGVNVKPVTRAVMFQLDGATNITLSCTNSVNLGTQYTYGLYTCADIGSGSATANTQVEFVAEYTYEGKSYKTRGYSWVKGATNNAGVFNDWREYKTIAAWVDVEAFSWVSPTIGSFESYVPSLVSSGSGSGYSVLGDSSYSFYYNTDSNVGQYKWFYEDTGTNASHDHTIDTSVIPTATYYLDASLYSNLSQTPLKVNYRRTSGTIDSDHITTLSNVAVTSATLNGTAITGFSVAGFSSFDVSSLNSTASYSFSGPIPTAGSTLILNTDVTAKYQAKSALGSASDTNTVKFKVKVITFDKSELIALVNSEKANNRQQEYSSSAAWTLYSSAYASAYAMMGKPNATQAEISQAISTLNSAITQIESGTSSASYTAVDYAIDRIPADFLTNPEYYTEATRIALQQAREDVAYDRPLNIFYQGVVDQMARNLLEAVNGLVYNSYTVQFNTQGGTVQSPITKMLYESVSEPDTTTARGGWVFAGWYYDTDCTNPVEWPITMPYNGITLYANWELDMTTISFNTDGGSTMASENVNVGGTYGGPTTTPTKDGYSFVGWYYDAARENPVTFPITNIPTGGYVLYAKWTPALYGIMFNTGGGSTVNAIIDYYGTSISAPEDPTWYGYNFVGWYYDSAYTRPVTWPVTMPYTNPILYAKWSSTTFRITYDTGEGGTEIPDASYDVNAQLVAPEDPTRPGYTFLYWSYLGSQFYFTQMPAFNLTLVAEWEALMFTIYFDSGDGTPVAPISQYCGTTVAAPADPTCEGYLFRGWLLNGETYTFTTMPSSSITLVANWIEIPDIAEISLKTSLPEGTTQLEQGQFFDVTLSMETNFFAGSSSFIVFYDRRYFSLAVNNVAYTTQTLSAALVNSGLVTRIDNFGEENAWNFWETGTIGGRANSTVVMPQYYPPTWRSGSSLTEEYQYYDYIQIQVACSQSSTSGGTIVMLSPEQDLFKFQMMVKEDAPVTENGLTANLLLPRDAIKGIDGTTATSNNKIYVNPKSSNSISTAGNTGKELEYVLNGSQYFTVVEREVKPSHTVSFNSAGGSAVESVTAEEGRFVQAPTAPEWENHTFDGWYLDGTLVEWPLTMPQSDITLVAHWIEHTASYTIKHYKQNTSGIGYSLVSADTQVLEAVIGSEVVATPNTYVGFSFYEDNSETTGNVLADNSLELIVRYLRNVTTMTFNSNGGSDVAPITQRYATDVTPPTDPTKTGFDFAGWSPELPTTMPAESETYTATWTPKQYIITFILNNETISEQSYAYGDAIVQPDIDIPTGQTFSGWTPSVPATVPASDMTFVGTIDEGGFLVTFVLNNQTISSFKVPEGSAINAPSYAIPEGYTFSGWSPEVPSVMPTPGMEYTFVGTTTKKRNTVTFYLDQGSGYQEYDSYTKLFGASYDIPAPYVPDGYTFSGWSPEPTGYIPAESTDYYGTLTATQYTYRFYINGELEKTVTGSMGTAVSAPVIPTEGYTFSGWSPEVPTSIGTSNQDFYASLSVNSYSIYFYVDNALRSDLTITQNYGTAVTAPSVSKENYVFSGWSPEVPTTMPANDLSVYGALTPMTNSVSFNANGADGVVPSNISGIIGETITLPGQGTLTKEGFNFLGWSTDPDATEALESYEISATAEVLYAVWGEIVVEVVELVSKEGSTTVIDRNNGYIYGIDESLSKTGFTNNYIAINGSGRVECLMSGNRVGTGTVVNFYNDTTGELIESFIVIIFGDVDGNGIVNARDISAANAGLSEGFEEEYLKTALNVYILRKNDQFNAQDLAFLHEAFTGEGINQEEIAISYNYYNG